MRSRWLWGAWIISALVACGRTSNHDEDVGDESPGTAGTTDAGAGVAGTGDEPRAGSGSGGASGAGGSAGGGPLTEPDPVTGCQDEVFQPECRDGSCSIVYSQGLKCAGVLSSLQAAGAAFLMQTTSPSSAQVFNLHFEGGLVLGDSFMGGGQRWLVNGALGPIVFEQARRGLVAVPSSLVFPVLSTMDISADGEDIYVLSHPIEHPRQVDLWRGNESTGAELIFSYPDAETATFIAGRPPTSLAVFDLDENSGEAALWEGTDILLWPLVGATFSSAKRLDDIVYVDHRWPGKAVASTSNQTLITLGKEWPVCNMPYQAAYPDVCETDHPPLDEGRLVGQVLAKRLVYAKEHPWLVTLQSDVDYQCRPITLNGCFETLPCDCSYGPSAIASPGVLRFQSLDSADSFDVDVGSLPDAHSEGELARYLLAVSTGSVFADFTVAIGLAGSSSSVRYLLVSGGSAQRR